MTKEDIIAESQGGQEDVRRPLELRKSLDALKENGIQGAAL